MTHRLSSRARSHFVAVLAVLLAFAAPLAFAAEVSWDTATEILGRIKAPTFPNRDFNIARFGAVADGKTDCTQAIADAIKACSEAGGGTVTVSGGTFLAGAVHLKSHINLRIAKDATLKFLTDPSHYLPAVYTRYEGTECFNYSAFIYAFEQQDIAVTGEGTLDGSASLENWWGWTKRGTDGSVGAASSRKLVELAESGTPVEKRVFGAEGKLRPNFIQLYRCKNILIEGIQMINSPMWELHPVLSSNITVRNVQISSHGPNNDGCDPESCRDVLIENCVFDTGDDCIAIKSGRNNDGRRVNVPSENFIVRNCVMKDGHGGVVIGSEISGGCRNIFVENCKMDSPNLDRALRFKNNAQRGGMVENIFMRNVEIGRVGEAVLTVDFIYEEGADGPHRPVARNIFLDRVTASASPRVLWVTGIPSGTIENIRISNSTFRGLTTADVVQNAGKIEFESVTLEPAKKSRSLNSLEKPSTK